MADPDIFQPYEKLVKVNILGQARMVPENNSLLRCFQFLSMKSISYGNFCWNGDCVNCRVSIRDRDGEKTVMACRTTVVEGMEIAALAEEIDLSTVST
jgi:predicted molibdopterin-dependent oxidoreductase YjgC